MSSEKQSRSPNPAKQVVICPTYRIIASHSVAMQCTRLIGDVKKALLKRWLGDKSLIHFDQGPPAWLSFVCLKRSTPFPHCRDNEMKAIIT
jgi:hypothetical protein